MRINAAFANNTEPVSVFISYSHQDEDFRIGLEKHLTLLKRRGVISIWNDRKIQAGREWEGEIHYHLQYADVILLLISSDFVASDYCWDVEMQWAIERHESGKSLVIPIIVRELDDWQSSPFGELQALPIDGKPLASWINIDEAYSTITREIRTTIESAKFSYSAAQGVTWILTLDTDLANVSKFRILQRLRRLVNELQLTLLGAEAGVRLKIASSKNAYNKVLEAQNESVLSTLLGVNVISVSQPIGALIRVRSVKLTEEQPTTSLLTSVGSNEPFEPIVVGMIIDPRDPIHPGFSLASHPSKSYSVADIAVLSQKLGKYLNTFLVVTKDNFYANLSPFEEGCGLPEPLQNTELGMKLLQQDLDLKMVSSLLMHPQSITGEAFWSALPTSENIDFVNRVWISPDSCTVKQYQEKGKIIVSLKKMRLRVFCESDYIESSNLNPNLTNASHVTDVFRNIIIPELENRVHLSSTFSDLRQIYSVLIVAKWMETEMNPLLERFCNTNDTKGLEEPNIAEKVKSIKEQYLNLLQRGSWTYHIRNPKNQTNKHHIYTVGGIELNI